MYYYLYLCFVMHALKDQLVWTHVKLLRAGGLRVVQQLGNWVGWNQ